MEKVEVNLLTEDDVLSTSSSTLMFQCTFKVSEFLTLIQSKLSEEKLFNEGLESEILSPGQIWTKGKVKLRLEFCSDSPELAAPQAVPASTTQAVPAESFGPPPVAKEDTQHIESATNYSPPVNKNLPLSLYQYSQPGTQGMWS